MNLILSLKLPINLVKNEKKEIKFKNFDFSAQTRLVDVSNWKKY